MCQNISSFNTNVYPLVVECNQKVIPTYSRTKKVRRTSFACTLPPISPSNVASDESKISRENSWKNQCQYKAKANFENFIDWHAGEQSDPCYRRMPTMNMNRSSFVSTNSIDRCHRNDKERNEVRGDLVDHTRDDHLEISQHHRMIYSQQFRSHNINGHGHRKGKFGSTRTSDCLLVLVCLLILAINQVFAKPFVSTDMSNAANIPSLDDTLRSPCRERSAPAEIQAQVNIRGILEIIGRQSGIARSIARKDVEEYLKIQEGVDVNEFHYKWRSKEQNWLYPKGKELPKDFNEPIPTEVRNHFKNAGRNFHMPSIIKLLQDCDERFQLLLIGFQTIFDDHIKKQPHMDLEKFNPLLDVFLRAKENAQKVLCEIRTALQKLGSTTVIIEPKSIQSSKSSDLIFYDWVIFREYINQLEHINEVVTVIRENLV